MGASNNIQAIEQIFKSESLLKNVIDIDSLYPISLSKAQNDPVLSSFFGLDEDGPFSELLQRGVQSLRKRFYKILTKPYYKTTISPGTFAATVYYYGETDCLIKYHANIGPLTNGSTQYRSVHRNFNNIIDVPIVGDFVKGRNSDTPQNHYLRSKERFYDTIFNQQKTIYVHESIWDPGYPTINRMKKVTWCFIDI